MPRLITKGNTKFIRSLGDFQEQDFSDHERSIRGEVAGHLGSTDFKGRGFMRRMTVRIIFYGVVLLLSVSLFSGCTKKGKYDAILRGGTVIDGTGAPGVVEDLAIRGDRIAAIGRADGQAPLTIDASGL